MATFLTIRKRVNHLLGMTNYGTPAANSVINSHINAAVSDIVNSRNFSWNKRTHSLALSASGITAMPSDYIPTWRITDARIVVTGQDSDTIFTEIPISDKDQYLFSDYVYWLDYNTTTSAYNFNSVTSAGTCPIVYNFEPTAMDADADICVVPDYELVSLLAVSKMWADDPAGEQKSQLYFDKAQTRLDNLWQNDISSVKNVKATLPTIKHQTRTKE